MIGAATPMVEYLGNNPTANVEAPMTVIVMRKVYLRPTRVADAAEHERAERPHQEACRVGCQSSTTTPPYRCPWDRTTWQRRRQ